MGRERCPLDASRSMRPGIKFIMNNNIILYDNTCRLCNGTVNRLKKDDRDERFSFIPFDSADGENYIQTYHLGDKIKNTVVHIHDEKYFIKSDVVLSVLRLLNKYKMFYFILRLVPKNLRDLVYDFIANNRHKWVGKISHQLTDKNH